MLFMESSEIGNISTCIECKREFKPYITDEVCHVCNGEGFLEDMDSSSGSDFVKCYQCMGNGQYKFKEYHFCDDQCKEQHFEDMYE